MAEWTGGAPWTPEGSAPWTPTSQQYPPRQYVGFQDFLNQFQQTPSQNGFQYNNYQQNPTGMSSRPPFPAPSNVNGVAYSNEAAYDPQGTYEWTSNVIPAAQPTSSFRLTATAEEFVPKSARSNQTAQYNTNVAPPVSEPAEITQAVQEMQVKPSRNDKKKSNKMGRSDGVTDWRRRDPEPSVEQASVPGNSRGSQNTSDADSYTPSPTHSNRNQREKKGNENTAFERNPDRNRGHRNKNDSSFTSGYNQEEDADKNYYRQDRNSVRNSETDSDRNYYRNSGAYERNESYNERSKSHKNDQRPSNSSAQGSRNYDNPGDRSNYQRSGRNSYYNERNKQAYESNRNAEMDGDKNGHKNKAYNMNETFRSSRRGEGVRDEGGDSGYYREQESYRAQGNGKKTKGNQQTKMINKKQNHEGQKDVGEESQRDRLAEQLNRGELECLVCCERVRQQESVWSCSNCFHVLHLKCVIRWATSSMTDGQWRCPACQNKLSSVPCEYRCFCGKRRNPEWSRGGDAAHTCGESCGRRSHCSHPCTLLCHPGPCPHCNATVLKKCECGATSQWLTCSRTAPLLCDQQCGRALNCKLHKCELTCHTDACQPCQLLQEQACHCLAAVKRSIPCTADSAGVSSYSCEGVCSRMLDCGHHTCQRSCHPGECAGCPLLPDKIKRCPCDQTLLKPEQRRTSCLDEIPTCGKVCSRPLACGTDEAPHFCKSPCHHGICPPCPDRTLVPCRCGHVIKKIPCVKLEAERRGVRCGKKCTKKQSCGRHRCNTLCCVDSDHRCSLPCPRTLSCGLHRCPNTCHSGHCEPCPRTSFEELRCACGASVRYPPVECGARPPACSQPCARNRPCGHAALHTCHPSPTPCPPCTVLTQKYCHGRHRMRKTIPCHQEDFSCGLPCGKELPCKKHKCIEICHKGNCPTVCKQPCETVRPTCGHPCSAACGHEGSCPSRLACRQLVRAVCPCGRRSAQRACADNARDLQRLLVAGVMGATGETVDISALIAKGNNTTTLECDGECQLEERNRRLAIGLQIRNPDLSAKLTPRYSDFMKQFAQRDEGFCNKIHEHLTQLVLLAQKSKQKTRSHSFQPMNRQKRQFVHEMCEHFGCEGVAYDTEPYRNIVATAFKEKSWLPALSLLEVVRRDKGQRKVPGPMRDPQPPTTSTSSGGSAWATLSSSLGVSSASSGDPELPRKPKIDYFDTPPED